MSAGFDLQRRLLGAVGEALSATDPQGKVISWDRAAQRLYGWSEEEAKGRPIVELTPSEEMAQRVEEIMSELRSGRSWSGEFVVRRKDGSAFPAQVTTTPVYDERGTMIATIGVSVDTTEIKKAEELRRSEERFRLLVEGVKDYAIFMLDTKGYITTWNEGARRIKGYETHEIVGKHFSVFYPADELSQGKPSYALGVAAKNGHYEEEGLRVRKDGSEFWATVLITALRDEEGNLRGFSKVVRDVTERRLMEERLRHQALHDPLTELPNRQLFMDRLQHALLRAKRRRGGKVAVLFVDLDNFKVVNNSLGHEAGDQLLAAVGERLRGCLRPEDTVARFGGDEFTVLLEDVKKPADAAKAAERLVKCLQQPFTSGGREFVVTGSIGIALGTARTQSPEKLLREADVAMYRAKEDSLLSYEIFDPIMEEQALERLELENDLRRALKHEELRVYYQPKFHLGQPNGIAEFEALVRWEHPRRGLMLPGEFIPIAEQTGLILPLGRWVLEEACRQAKEWQERYPSEPSLAVCVNVSAEQVRQSGLAREVGSALRESGLKPESLILEITEGTLLKETRVNEAVLGELKALGVGLAIDDFGKEYSSLYYLKWLPAEGLKLDPSFAKDLGENRNTTTIVRAVISLAHSLGLKVTGEGVESAEQLECLRELGCDFAQGYYLAKPLPSEEVEPLLAAPGQVKMSFEET